MLKTKHLLIGIVLIAGLAIACDVAGWPSAAGRKTRQVTAGPQVGHLRKDKPQTPRMRSDRWHNYVGSPKIEYGDGPRSAAPQCAAADQYTPVVAVRELYFNPDGSCVQDSIAEHAVKVAHRNASLLIWNSSYGQAVRGGSNLSRVSAYCQARGIQAFIISQEATWPWMQWAGMTGRGAAVSLGKQHYQTVHYYDARRHIWYVEDNRTPRLIEPYDDVTFHEQHVAGGQWTVILDTHAPPPLPLSEVRRIKLGSLTWISYLFT